MNPSITESAAPPDTNTTQKYSDDPFHPNYRKLCPWDEEQRTAWVADWPVPLSKNFWELYECAERAEHTRAADQLDILLRQRGLEQRYKDELLRNAGSRKDREERYARLRDLLSKEAPELLERAENIWRIQEARISVVEGERSLDYLLEIGDLAGYRWLPLAYPDLAKTMKTRSIDTVLNKDTTAERL